MISKERKRFGVWSTAAIVSLAALPVVLLSGCRPDEPEQVAGWSMLAPDERHPIVVTQEPHNMTVKIARGSAGLNPQQRVRIINFLEKYRAADAGDSKLVITAPSGSANEVAAMQAVAEIRFLTRETGFDDSSITVEAYHDDRDPQPPVRLSYSRFRAQGPECGMWPTNVAENRTNAAFENFGCATQRNLAAHVANPADLLGPRSMSPRDSTRRDHVNTKYQSGEGAGTTKGVGAAGK